LQSNYNYPLKPTKQEKRQRKKQPMRRERLCHPLKVNLSDQKERQRERQTRQEKRKRTVANGKQDFICQRGLKAAQTAEARKEKENPSD
jgi:hypothetical protein